MTTTEPGAQLLPGILNPGDRLAVTGPAGCGKTRLLHQVAVCAAAGLHPFTLDPGHPPRRVLVCLSGLADRVHLRAAVRAAQLAEPGTWPGEMMWSWSWPAGHAGRAARRYLASMLDRVRPELVIAGDLAYLTGPADDATGFAAFTEFWDDQIRHRRLAVAVEACDPSTVTVADLKRAGAAAVFEQAAEPHPLRRWPDLGIAIYPQPDGAVFLSPWRCEHDDGAAGWPAILEPSPGPWAWQVPACAQ